MKQSITEENSKNSQTSNIVVSDEEIEKILQKWIESYNRNSTTHRILLSKYSNILHIIKLISSKKDAECEQRLNNYHNKIIKDLKEMGFNSLDDVELKFKEKDAEIKELNEDIAQNNRDINLLDIEVEKLKSNLEEKEQTISDKEQQINVINKILELKLENSIPKSEIKKNVEVIYNACNDERVFEIQTRLGNFLRTLEG